MALTQFTFASAGALNDHTPAAIASSFVSESITPDSNNQQTTVIASLTLASPVICRVATDTSIYVAFGSNPNALTSTGVRAFVPANAVEYFIVKHGDKAAVVTTA